jgi:hypothetical protein
MHRSQPPQAQFSRQGDRLCVRLFPRVAPSAPSAKILSPFLEQKTQREKRVDALEIGDWRFPRRPHYVEKDEDSLKAGLPTARFMVRVVGSRFMALLGGSGFKEGESQRLAQSSDGDRAIRLRFGPPNLGGGERGLGIDKLSGNGQALIEAGTNQFRAFPGLIHHLVRDGQPLASLPQGDSGLFEFKIKRQPKLPIFFPGGFQIGFGFFAPGLGQQSVP